MYDQLYVSVRGTDFIELGHYHVTSLASLNATVKLIEKTPRTQSVDVLIHAYKLDYSHPSSSRQKVLRRKTGWVSIAQFPKNC